MKKLNIGIVGLGRLGKEYANNIQYKVPNANLIAACSCLLYTSPSPRDPE